MHTHEFSKDVHYRHKSLSHGPSLLDSVELPHLSVHASHGLVAGSSNSANLVGGNSYSSALAMRLMSKPEAADARQMPYISSKQHSTCFKLESLTSMLFEAQQSPYHSFLLQILMINQSQNNLASSRNILANHLPASGA